MTIDASWIKLMKSQARHAFSKTCPVRPHVVFIDGQINLMKSDKIVTWNAFVLYQFQRKIEAAFRMGARVVVLGFDNYAHVPRAKNMTQKKRMDSMAAMKFTADQELPASIPINWPSAIKNRVFKTKVIGMVMRSLRGTFANETAGSLVFDFMGSPEVVGLPMAMPRLLQSPLAAELPRGECDIKAFAWQTLGPLLIESTDGDFMPLALLQFESAQNRAALDSGAPRPHEIILHRLKTKIGEPDETKGREFEYVSISKLANFVQSEPTLSTARTAGSDSQQPRNSNVRSLAALIAMTGCDFCLNLPQLGPKTLWKLRHFVKHRDLDSEHGQLAFIVLALCEVNATALKHSGQYARVHKLAAQSSTPAEALAAYESFHAALVRLPTLAARTRGQLWQGKRMRAHVRNSMWTTQYWTRLHEHPDPLAGDFGFEAAGNGTKFAGV